MDMDASRPGGPPTMDAPSVRATKALMALHAAVWIMFGMVAASPTSPTPVESEPAWAEAFLMFANAAVLAFFSASLRPSRPYVFLGAVAVILVNLVLTVADQMGAFDVFVLFLNVLTLGLLFTARGSLAARGGRGG